MGAHKKGRWERTKCKPAKKRGKQWGRSVDPKIKTDVGCIWVHHIPRRAAFARCIYDNLHNLVSYVLSKQVASTDVKGVIR